jgi:N utilization substance protein B
MRSTAREVVYKYLFSRNFNGEDPKLYRALCEDSTLNSDDKSFADALLKTILNNYDSLLKTVEDIVEGYKLDRIFTTDKCSLIMGIAELKFFDTPKAVVIDEVVSLAGIYSTDKSVDFVNGVLAKFVKDL